MEYTDFSCIRRGCFVYYEFYIDQFFLEHLLTGFLLIAVTVSLRRQNVSWKRMLAGSAAGAAAVTAFVCLGMPGWYFAGMLLAGTVVFAGTGREEFLGGLFFLLLVSVCFGGVLQALVNLFGFPLLLGSAAAAAALWLAGRCLSRRKALRDSLVTVRLQWEERTETLRGLIDTGNRLEEPLTGRPVSIVDASPARRLLGEAWEERRGFYLIPYHSVGTEKGWMRGVTIDSMTVELPQRTEVVRRPVLAIYEGELSAGARFQMVLHPLHIQAGK